MKKSFFFTSTFILLALVATAQLELKPAIGLTVAKFDSDPVFEMNNDSLVTDRKAGYQFGASLAIGRKLFAEPGIFYTRLVQDMQPTMAEKEDFKYSAGYLRIPVNFGFQFIGTPNSLAGLRIFLGPSIMFPLSIKENDYPIEKDNVTSPQFDIFAGAGLNVWFLFLDVSYGWGLTPQFTDDPIEAKMQSLYANVGFRFKLKSEEY